MKRVIATLLTYVTIGAATIFGVLNSNADLPEAMIVEAEPIDEPVSFVDTPVQTYDTVKTAIKSRMITSEPEEQKVQTLELEEIEEPTQELLISEDELELLCLVTMAEAEGESELGKRLVIDTILNRVDSELSYFPDTITDVIYQKNAFTSMHNGRVDRCYVMDDIRQLVLEELESRTNSEVMYFCAGDYSKYGTPMFSEGNHYFSSN